MKDMDTKVLNGIAVRDGDVRFFFSSKARHTPQGWSEYIRRISPREEDFGKEVWINVGQLMRKKGCFATGCQPPSLWTGR